jgi:hypothetical protein
VFFIFSFFFCFFFFFPFFSAGVYLLVRVVNTKLFKAIHFKIFESKTKPPQRIDENSIEREGAGRRKREERKKREKRGEEKRWKKRGRKKGEEEDKGDKIHVKNANKMVVLRNINGHVYRVDQPPKHPSVQSLC